jgi:DNA invertase Pin-like site-specific DNA recombinase
MTAMIPAVIYAAKSTEDKHGSIGTQIEDCKALADREGWVVDEAFSDEGFSAYSGNRGPQLERAKLRASELGAEHGRCVLVAQDADRLARGAGDKPGAADHLIQIHAEMGRQMVELWSVRHGRRLTRRDAFDEGERAYQESERKTQAVRAGLKRRKNAGKPVGPVPLGYIAEVQVENGRVVLDEDGNPITKRVIDPATLSTVERIFALVESGSTFGDVARTLNLDGILTSRGKTWQSRNVRRILHNRAYVGEKGYPKIIEPDRFDRIHAGLKRLDPAGVAKRQGGRKPVDDTYFLRGIARCQRCDAMMYTARRAIGRVYMCAHRRQGTGLCNAPPIPAELIESHVLRHLDTFVGSVEDWVVERLAERDGERHAREASLTHYRARLRTLETQRQRHLAEYRKLVDMGATAARIALEEVERIDRERVEQERLIEETQAVLDEWSGPPDVDAALDFYNGLVGFVQGRIQKADGLGALNQALQQVLAGLWCEIEEYRERILVEFELVKPRSYPPGGVEFVERRPSLAPRLLLDRMPPEPLSQTETQTKVNRCLAEGRARLRVIAPRS